MPDIDILELERDRIALGLTPTTVKTAPYTLAPGDLVLVDSTGGAVALSLPSSAPDGSIFGVRIVAGTNWTVTALGGALFAGGDGTLYPTSGRSATFVPRLSRVAGASWTWRYHAADALYQPWDNDLMLAQLDARYLASSTTTSYGRALLTLANLAALLATVGPTGTPSAANFLRGDGSWQTAPTSPTTKILTRRNV